MSLPSHFVWSACRNNKWRTVRALLSNGDIIAGKIYRRGSVNEWMWSIGGMVRPNQQRGT